MKIINISPRDIYGYEDNPGTQNRDYRNTPCWYGTLFHWVPNISHHILPNKSAKRRSIVQGNHKCS
uniref:Uncharacterized protein n=1 Tax=Arundo donax TaxID=35708 RepID=A0A0A9AD88_ARUDO